MHEITELTSLIRDTVLTELKKISEQMGKFLVTQAEHKGRFDGHSDKIRRIEKQVEGLDCRANERTLNAMDKRVRTLEDRAQSGHVQDEECRNNSKEIISMRANIRDNASKNAEQEKRYSAAIKGLFGIITGIAILVGYAFLAKHWR